MELETVVRVAHMCTYEPMCVLARICTCACVEASIHLRCYVVPQEPSTLSVLFRFGVIVVVVLFCF